LGVRVREAAIPLARLPEVAELFATSTGPDIAPLVSLDGRAIGDGTVGPVTRSVHLRGRDRWGRKRDRSRR